MISVVTPSFRQLEWLKLCAASVADQAGVEVEHIVQDGGSGDDLEKWAATQPHLKVLSAPDDGMYDAINRGLRRAQGEICAYLNCDEQYLPGTLAKVAEFFAEHPETEVLFGDFLLVDAEGLPIAYRRVVLPTPGHLRVAPLNTGSCATFFRRELLDRGHFFDVKWKASGDAAWVENLLAERVRMSLLNEPLATFTLTGQNLGQALGAQEEGVRRQAASAAGRETLRWSQLVLHRFRKLFAGAYRTRRIELEIYTFDSPGQRQLRVGEKVGFYWPTQPPG